MHEPTPGGYIPDFPVEEPSRSGTVIARLGEAHASTVAVRREFLKRREQATQRFRSGEIDSSELRRLLTSSAEDLSGRLKRDCQPAVQEGRKRISDLASRGEGLSAGAAAELEALAGKRFWN